MGRLDNLHSQFVRLDLQKPEDVTTLEDMVWEAAVRGTPLFAVVDVRRQDVGIEHHDTAETLPEKRKPKSRASRKALERTRWAINLKSFSEETNGFLENKAAASTRVHTDLRGTGATPVLQLHADAAGLDDR